MESRNMDQAGISLASHQKTAPCEAALEREDEEVHLASHLEKIYQLTGASSSDLFVFTSSAAEAINQVLLSVFLKVSRITGKCHFITSEIEDAPTLQMMKRLEELGCFVKTVKVNGRGEIDLKELKEMITPRTALISITMAHGLTGVIQPVEEIVQMGREKGVLVHLEGSYATGKYPFSLEEIGADYFTFGGNLIHSLPGTGALFAKQQSPLSPLIVGGASLRGGPMDVASVIALGKSARQASLFLDTMALEVARKKQILENEIVKTIPEAKILFKDSLKLPNTSVIAFPQMHQEALFTHLQKEQIETSIGGDYQQHIAQVLLASKISNELAFSSLSFSLSRLTTEIEIRKAVETIKKTVDFLAPLSLPPVDPKPFSPSQWNKKLREKIGRFRFGGKFTEEEARQKGMRLVIGRENEIVFSLLVDESDGVIADVKFQAFGPTALFLAAELSAELMIRKDYRRASRITADLIDQQGRDKKEIPAFPKEADRLLNCVLSAIDVACRQCEDIVCLDTSYDVTPIEWDLGENQTGIAGWGDFAHEKKLAIIEEVIDKEIRPYVELDAGGVQVVELKENGELSISYQGSCTTCHSATGSTLSAIQQILQARVHPTLTVIPILF